VRNFFVRSRNPHLRLPDGLEHLRPAPPEQPSRARPASDVHHAKKETIDPLNEKRWKSSRLIFGGSIFQGVSHARDLTKQPPGEARSIRPRAVSQVNLGRSRKFRQSVFCVARACDETFQQRKSAAAAWGARRAHLAELKKSEALRTSQAPEIRKYLEQLNATQGDILKRLRALPASAAGGETWGKRLAWQVGIGLGLLLLGLLAGSLRSAGQANARLDALIAAMPTSARA
jgi:hypothetical protein